MIYKSPIKPILNIKGILYELLGEFDIYRVKNISKLKKILKGDVVISKTKGKEKKYLVCRIIEEATILEDVENQ